MMLLRSLRLTMGNAPVSMTLALQNVYKSAHWWEVVVAQLVERLLPIPEICSSNPVIGKIYIEHLFTCLKSTVLKRRKQMKKRLGMAHLKKIAHGSFQPFGKCYNGSEPPQLGGSVCAYHPLALGLIPKHKIYAFSIYI